ncbi:MAG: TonB-dependent receptor plug domain-containing protein [Pseudomonadota bacterium]
MNPKQIVPALGIALASLCAPPLAAAAEEPALQATTQPTPELAARQVYVPADFARFVPRTALDMARQIPGFPINEGGNDRGFGQADTNILVNGRRVSGKSNGPVAALARIPVGDVQRLEILDGASLDIGGLSGQVLNVVTATGGRISGRFFYSPQHRTDNLPFRWGNAELSLSGGSESTEWTLTLRNDQQQFGSKGPEFVTDGAGNALDTRDERNSTRFDVPGVAGSLTREFGGGSVLNVSGEINGFIRRDKEYSERNPVNGIANTRNLRESEDELNYEVGVDYEFPLGAGRLKLIGLHLFENSPTKSRVEFEFADGRPTAGSLFEREADEFESVLRAEYGFERLGGDWQVSLEGARNILDIEAELAVRDALGQLMAVDLPGASSRVEEDRAEFTVSYGRALSSQLQLQTSVGVEYSEISQAGEFGQTRDFVRPKGFASLNWRANDALNLALRLERSVGQLNFFDFISSVNIDQERENVTNSNLVPPQSWLAELQVQLSFGELGSMTLTGFYEELSDIVDLIPIAGGGQAPGNIDSARRYGGSANVTLQFDGLGWRGARLDVETNYTDSEVRDPLLGNRRRISDQDYLEYGVTLRQDFPGTDWAVGFEMFYDEESPLVRLDEVSQFKPSAAFTRVFIEKKDLYGVTVRAMVGNLNDRTNDFFRTSFVDRAAGQIDFREERFRGFGTLYELEIEGSF